MTTERFLMLEEHLVAPFWQATEQGKLMFPKCTACETFNWYPSKLCHKCYSEERVWIESKGRARLYSWSVVNFPFLPDLQNQLPLLPGVIDLEDMPIRMVTRIVGVTEEQLHPGMVLEVTYKREGERNLPLFRPME